MKGFAWDAEKNTWLKKTRGISFEDIIFHINCGDLLATLDHPNPGKYENQQVFIVWVSNYVYFVPFIETGDHYFLKTIIPSRKWTKIFLKKDYL